MNYDVVMELESEDLEEQRQGIHRVYDLADGDGRTDRAARCGDTIYRRPADPGPTQVDPNPSGAAGGEFAKPAAFVTDRHGVTRRCGRIRREVIPSLEPIEAWIVDETSWLKQGRHSVGVARQYCGAVGKTANCQVSVEVAVSDGWIAAPVAGRLYLPEIWAGDRARCHQVGVPEDIPFATKPMIAWN